ncbi:MAG: iron-containing alcohol dehydrogenase [Clostridia bacterium]|jgi:alcohol dehydrogenase YqhD (iron-dependent ADH family)|nr:iron-containing alcohol dehydrogenase [Clostridia bacterium]
MQSLSYLLMKSFNNTTPVKILCGENIYLQLPAKLYGRYKKVLLLCADTSLDCSIYEKFRTHLINSHIPICETLFIAPNPTASTLSHYVKKCNLHRADCIIALGGGSVMDAAKYVGMTARDSLISIPVITVPTFSATGSEVSSSAVLINDNTQKSYSLKCHFPLLTIMDPVLTAAVPVNSAACGSLSIFHHIFEFYLGAHTDNELLKSYAESLICSTMKAVEKMIKYPDNLDARSDLLWSAALARTQFSGLGSHHHYTTCHHLAKSFSCHLHISYNLSLSLLMPIFLHKLSKIRPQAFTRFSRNVFGLTTTEDSLDAQIGCDSFINWLKTVGLLNGDRTVFRNFISNELSPEHLALIIWESYNTAPNTCSLWTYKDILQILMTMFSK